MAGVSEGPARARVAPEITLPETVTEDHDHLTAGVIFVGNEDAAARGPHAERIEKILSDTRAGEALRLAHEQGRPVVVRATTAEEVKAALARPEVASAIVTDRALLDLDLTELTYG